MSDDEQLRAAFRHGADPGLPPGADTDALLARVHRGGRRRRTRRTAGVVTACAGSVAVVAAGVASLTPVSGPEDEAATATATARDGTVVASELAVYDVHASKDAVWALASGDCGRGQLCPVVARSTDEATSWDLGEPQAPTGAAALAQLRFLEVSDDGRYALAAGTGVATSRDAGDTWRPVELARGRSVRGAAVGAARSVLVFDEPGADSLATARTGAGDWARAEAPVEAGEWLVEPFAAGDVVGATVLAGRSGAATSLVVGDGADGWTRVEAPCRTRTPLVTTDGATVWYLCHGAGASVLATSPDLAAPDGPGWTLTDLPAARDAGLGTWGAGTAVVATGHRVFRVGADGGSEELTGPGSGLDLPADDYTFRAAANGWLASFRGVLFHQVDGGNWVRVPVP